MTWALNSRFDTEMAQVICSKHKELHFFLVVRSISNLSILLSVLNFTFLFFAFNCSNMSNSSFYIFLINLWKCFRYLTPYFILFEICKWPISYYYYLYIYIKLKPLKLPQFSTSLLFFFLFILGFISYIFITIV